MIKYKKGIPIQFNSKPRIVFWTLKSKKVKIVNLMLPKCL